MQHGRGVALADFNRDGRTDIVYGNWNGPHRLFMQLNNRKQKFKVGLEGLLCIQEGFLFYQTDPSSLLLLSVSHRHHYISYQRNKCPRRRFYRGQVTVNV